MPQFTYVARDLLTRARRHQSSACTTHAVQVSPFVCYLLAVANAAAYGTLVRVAVGQGEGAAAELLSAVGLNTAAVAEQVGAVPVSKHAE